MGEETKISWADDTFNIVWGCEKVSPACKNCYAETWAKRMGHEVWGHDAPRRVFGEKHWREPLKWDSKAKQEGRPRKVFCGSMCDVFEDNPTVNEERQKLWPLIAETQNLIWLLLTKRPENVCEMVPSEWLEKWPENVWMGATVENQEYAEVRIPELIEIPAKIRFLSCEPLLEEIDLLPWLCVNSVSDGSPAPRPDGPLIHWVITGDESGRGRRPTFQKWVRSLCDQCGWSMTKFYYKQLVREDGRKIENPMLGGRTWTEVPSTS